MAILQDPIMYICDRCDAEMLGFSGQLPAGWSVVQLMVRDSKSIKEKIIHTCGDPCTSHAMHHPRDFFMTGR